MSGDNGGSVFKGSLWMVAVPVLLFWLPGVGGFIGGLVGGKVAGGVGGALLAWLLSSLLVGALFMLAGSMLTGLIAIGILAGAGALMLALVDSGARLLGALIGGLIA